MKKTLLIAVTALLGLTSPAYGMWSTIKSAYVSKPYYTPWGEPCSEPWTEPITFVDETTSTTDTVIPQQPKPVVPKALEKEIVTALKNTSLLTTKDKIALIQQAIQQGADINERIDDKPILAYAIETLDLDLVKFLIETCKADYNATIRLPLPQDTDTPQSIENYMVDSYSKTLVPRKSVHDFTMIEFALNTEVEVARKNKNYAYPITSYLNTLSDIHFSRESLEIVLATSPELVKKFLQEHTDYPRMVLPLNHILWSVPKMIFRCLQENVITARDILESATIMLSSGVLNITAPLTECFDALVNNNTDLVPLKKHIAHIFTLIDTHATMNNEYKLKNMNHKIFDIIKHDITLNKATITQACKYAQEGDFTLAKTLLKNTHHLQNNTLPLKEILELVEYAALHGQNSVVLSLLQYLSLHNDIKDFTATLLKAAIKIGDRCNNLKDRKLLQAPGNQENITVLENLNFNLLQLLTITLYYKMPHHICTIMEESNSLPKLEKPTSNETLLLGMIASLKRKLRWSDIENMLHRHGKELIEKQEWHKSWKIYSYHCFSSMLLAQLWNITPSNQPHRFLMDRKYACEIRELQTLAEEGYIATPYISTNAQRIGPDAAWNILQFTGGYYFEKPTTTDQK